jgi:dihydroxyacetone kinase-like protein
VATFGTADVRSAMLRVSEALDRENDELTRLDQALGDGDLGITAEKIAGALRQHAEGGEAEDLAKFVMSAGMAVNRAASSTMGTLVATGLLRAGKAIEGEAELSPASLARMLEAADEGVQARGKAKPGDKTVIDALHPAAVALRQHLEAGEDLPAAARLMLLAAEEGRDSVTGQRSRVGRAGWVGERTEGAVDPGCQMLVVMLQALVGS